MTHPQRNYNFSITITTLFQYFIGLRKYEKGACWWSEHSSLQKLNPKKPGAVRGKRETGQVSQVTLLSTKVSCFLDKTGWAHTHMNTVI